MLKLCIVMSACCLRSALYGRQKERRSWLPERHLEWRGMDGLLLRQDSSIIICLVLTVVRNTFSFRGGAFGLVAGGV